jgi:hypothetical protein
MGAARQLLGIDRGITEALSCKVAVCLKESCLLPCFLQYMPEITINHALMDTLTGAALRLQSSPFMWKCS